VEYLTRTGAPPAFFEMATPANPNANKRRIAYVEMMDKLGFEPNVVSVQGQGWAFEEIGRNGALEVLTSGRLNSNSVCAAMTGLRSVFCRHATRWECASEGGRIAHCVSPPMTTTLSRGLPAPR
jgi:hypothetical protein